MHKSRAVILVAVLALAGCSKTTLHDLRTTEPGPDEFSVIPAKPLTAPADYSALPVPTPGQGNATDHHPLQDAVAALGGRPSAMDETVGASATDAGLVHYVSRFGVPAGIRQTVAEEDADFRKRRGRFLNIRLAKKDRYSDVYKRQRLNQHNELLRWRRAGAQTPSAPPKGRR